MKKAILITVIFIQPLMTVFAQDSKSNGLMIGVGTYVNNNPRLGYYVTSEYNWQISKILTLSTGGRLVYSKIDEFWNEEQSTYFFNENIFKLNSVSAIKFYLPLHKSFGLESSTQFIFEPIPLGLATLNTNSNHKVENETKYVFTQFNPGYLINLGLYKDFSYDGKKVRFVVGFGYGWYDLYKDYRVANFSHSKQVRANTSCYNIYINITLF